MCCCVRIGGVSPSGRSSSASSSAARYRSTQFCSSAASATSDAGASSESSNAVRRSRARCDWNSTNSARVIVVAAAYTWKRNGMNGITHLSGTAAFSLYISTKSIWPIAAPSPGAASSALAFTASHQLPMPASPSASMPSRSGKNAAIFERKASNARSWSSFRPGYVVTLKLKPPKPSAA